MARNRICPDTGAFELSGLEEDRLHRHRHHLIQTAIRDLMSVLVLFDADETYDDLYGDLEAALLTEDRLIEIAIGEVG